MYTEERQKIKIIQGDTYTLDIDFEGITLDLINNIYFSCDELSICKKLNKYVEENLFRLFISSEESKEYPSGVYNYDLTVEFAGETVKTVQYRSIITILEKNNKVVCYER